MVVVLTDKAKDYWLSRHLGLNLKPGQRYTIVAGSKICVHVNTPKVSGTMFISATNLLNAGAAKAAMELEG